MNVFPYVVWILVQLLAFVLKLQQKIHGQESTELKAALMPQYLLSRMFSIIFSCGFFLRFGGGFH